MANAAGDTHNNHATWFKYMELYLTIKNEEMGIELHSDAFKAITDDIISTQYDYSAMLPYETFRPDIRLYYTYGTIPIIRSAVVLQMYFIAHQNELSSSNLRSRANSMWHHRSQKTDTNLIDAVKTLHEFAVKGNHYPFPDTTDNWLNIGNSATGYEDIHWLTNAWAPSVPSKSYSTDMKK
ncbi:hypothetical protein SARC_12206, partial [Sphaeroforma arctica JP610]